MLTKEEQVTSFQTLLHIRLVNKLIHRFVTALLERGDNHDQSKLEYPEVGAFTKADELGPLKYGTEEYKRNCESIKDALDHHYARNDHHPQHFKNGVDDMNLLQLVEMFLDWKASSLRSNDGNIRKSIEINADRYRLSPQLVKVFENTAGLFDDIKGDSI